jgi:ankyrin repeat protein
MCRVGRPPKGVLRTKARNTPLVALERRCTAVPKKTFIAFCLAVFFLCIGITVCAREKAADTEISEKLITNVSQLLASDLHDAASRCNLQQTTKLLEAGADVNSSEGGVSPLFLAATEGCLEVVQILIRSGADVNIKNSTEGLTALQAAAHNGHLEVVKYLASKNANVNASGDKDAMTPLHRASLNGHLEVVKYLVSKGGNVNAKSKKDNTPLHAAAHGGYLEVVKWLIDNGASINVKEKEFGTTPLHQAVAFRHFEVVKYLFSHGADVNAKDQHGNMPLDVAIKSGYKDIADYLRENDNIRIVPFEDGYCRVQGPTDIEIKKGGVFHLQDATYKGLTFGVLTDPESKIVLEVGSINVQVLSKAKQPVGEPRMLKSISQEWDLATKTLGVMYSDSDIRVIVHLYLLPSGNSKTPGTLFITDIECEPGSAQSIKNRILREKLIAEIDFYSWMKESLKVSADSKRLAYAARVDNRWLVVVDGKEQKQYDGIAAGTPIFSPDSKQLAYAARAGNKWFVVVDGKEQKQYDGVGDIPIFSPDSKRLAYAARAGNKWFVVVDGKEQKQYDGVGNIIFSPDSKRLACGAQIGTSWFVVVDGKEQKQYDGIVAGTLILSPDSKRVAYAARIGNKQVVVVDGKEQKQYDMIGAGSLVFSADSRRLAYGAKLENREFVVLDGYEGKQYDGIGNIIFSPNSKRVAYAAQIGDKQVVVVDAKEGKRRDGISLEGRIVFDSPDSLHYLALIGNAIYLVEESTK